MANILRPISLPTHCLIHSTVIEGLGLYGAIFGHMPFRSSLFGGHKILIPDGTKNPRVADTNILFCLVSCTLMLPYFLSSYMPIRENQWLHVSVPMRLLLSGALCGNVLFRGEGMSEEGFWEFLGLGLLDLSGALAVGFELGTFSGMVPHLVRGNGS